MTAATPPAKAPAKKSSSGRAAGAAADLATLLREARAYAGSTLADRTREEYGKQWAAFERWRAGQALSALPTASQTLCLYLAHRAGQRLRVATLAQGLSAIAYEHLRHGHANPLAAPELAQTWAGIRRKHGAAPNQKAPATTVVVRAMIEALPTWLLGVRDRALIALQTSRT